MQPDPKTPPVGNILVVDDTPANLRLLSGMLAEQGYKVRSAPNGKLALMGVQASPPDLILLDINMPGLNGYEVCQRLKADEATADIPVIFISALDQTEDKIKAFTMGGVDYITKPFQLEEVLARVETHLTLHRLQLRLASANAELSRSNAELAASNADLEAFAHTVAHDLKTPLSTVIGFSSLTESRLGKMPEATVRENLGRITRTGYKMRDIIEELLLLASVRRTEQVEASPLEMAAIIADVLDRLETRIAETEAEVLVPESWRAALGYAPWIEEVWVNYVSNALKYGGDADAGVAPRVELGCRPVDGGAMVCFWARDNGPGLSPEALEKVFAPFTRFNPSKVDGHGLGLSIVQRIVEKQGGAVGVTCPDAPEKGCEFWFTLPAAK